MGIVLPNISTSTIYLRQTIARKPFFGRLGRPGRSSFPFSFCSIWSFLRRLIGIDGKYTVYSDGGSWYREACSYLGLKHLLHSPFEKSIVERTIEYLKDRTEASNDYYPCMKAGSCNLQHAFPLLIPSNISVKHWNPKYPKTAPPRRTNQINSVYTHQICFAACCSFKSTITVKKV